MTRAEYKRHAATALVYIGRALFENNKAIDSKDNELARAYIEIAKVCAIVALGAAVSKQSDESGGVD